jgi:hypothetical protein
MPDSDVVSGFSRSLLRYAVALAAVLWAAAGLHGQSSDVIQFIFTSDSHYGITRPEFQGAKDVDAHIVNAVLVAKINTLPNVKLPRTFWSIPATSPIGRKSTTRSLSKAPPSHGVNSRPTTSKA